MEQRQLKIFGGNRNPVLCHSGKKTDGLQRHCLTAHIRTGDHNGRAACFNGYRDKWLIISLKIFLNLQTDTLIQFNFHFSFDLGQ
jgi:hypothetical protein